MTIDYILPLSDSKATLETAGGKGALLVRLVNANLPVPDGFHITTRALLKKLNLVREKQY